MGLFMQVKQAKDVDVSVVGHVAKQRARLQDHLAQPFSLVLTSDLIQQMFVAADLETHLGRLPQEQPEQIKLFSEVTEKLRMARPNQAIMEAIRESFELITLDTTDLQSLAHLATQKSVLGIIPSPSYDMQDNQGQRLFVSGDTFETFYEQIKVCVVSFFTPKAIQYRLQRNIVDWRLALIVFRLPNIHNCLTVTRSEQGSKVQSYVGLPDIRKAVEKDEFEVKGAIPQITDRKIREQKTVCVYALDQNQIVAKEYHTTSTSLQSAPDYDVMEVNRLAKKILQVWNGQKVHALFVKQKQGTLSLLDAYLEPLEPEDLGPNMSMQDVRLQTSQEITGHLPELEQAIRDDNHQGIRHIVDVIKNKLHRLLE